MAMKIGFMSFAHMHTHGYVSILKSMGVDVVGADSDAARAGACGEELGIPILESYDALLSSGVDGVVIGAENVKHRELAEQAAAAGVYVLSEKPLATTIEDCKAMIAACDKAGVGLMVAFPMRFSPPITRVIGAVQSGSMGQLCAIAGRNPGSLPGGWFTDVSLSGGGAVMDHTVHLGDIMCLLTGAEPATVYAQTNAIIRPDAGVETAGLLSIRFTDGTIATIDTSWSRLPTYPTWGGTTMEVVGSEATMQVDGFAEYVNLYGAQHKRLNFDTDSNRPMLAEFLASIRERRAPVPDGRAGLLATSIVLAAYESARTDSVVNVAL